jgi:hypothetical protein
MRGVRIYGMIFIVAFIAYGLNAQFSSHLPIIVIDTDGQDIPDDNPRIIAQMGVIDNGDGIVNNLSDPFNDYDGRISIEHRGASSLMFPKKNFSLETQDSLGANLNIQLLGLPGENDWVLHGPYSDKTQMRNVFTFRIANVMGRYASRTRFCELFLNDNYRGVYVLMEKIKRDGDRVDIAPLDPDDTQGDSLTGGYVIRIDWYEGAGSGWTSFNSDDPINFAYHHPQADNLTSEQKSYIKNYVTQFENTLAGSGFKDPENGYRKFIDTESFVDYLIVNEFSRNVDGFSISVYMHKERDSRGGKLFMGPVWDFNLAYGNQYEGDFWEPERWVWQWGLDPIPFWWERLHEDPYFTEMLNCRWFSLRKNILSLDSIYNLIDGYIEELGPAIDRNFERWPVLGVEIWPNHFVGETYEEEIEILKWWIAERLDWLDDNMPGSCPTLSTIKIEAQAADVSVYPNPSDGRFYIDIKKTIRDQAEIEIFSVDGKLFYRSKAFDSTGGLIEIDLTHLDPGIYFIKVNNLPNPFAEKIVII